MAIWQGKELLKFFKKLKNNCQYEYLIRNRNSSDLKSMTHGKVLIPSFPTKKGAFCTSFPGGKKISNIYFIITRATPYTYMLPDIRKC